MRKGKIQVVFQTQTEMSRERTRCKQSEDVYLLYYDYIKRSVKKKRQNRYKAKPLFLLENIPGAT